MVPRPLFIDENIQKQLAAKRKSVETSELSSAIIPSAAESKQVTSSCSILILIVGSAVKSATTKIPSKAIGKREIEGLTKLSGQINEEIVKGKAETKREFNTLMETTSSTGTTIPEEEDEANQKQVREGKCIDELPAELLMRIFRHLSKHELLSAEMVCLRWNCIIRHHIWPIQRSIVFRKEESVDFVQGFLAQRGHFLREIHFEQGELFTDFLLIDRLMDLNVAGALERVSIENLSGQLRKEILARLTESDGNGE